MSGVALKVETSRWLSSGKLVAPKKDNIHQDREKALYPGAACTGQGSVEKRPKKGSGKDEKAGFRKELNHAEI